jgi:homocitrate synthase NifV
MLPYLHIVDTTLRDGEQMPGTSFTGDEKMDLVRRLADAGIDEIEAGIPAMGVCECAFLHKVAEAALPCRVTVWCRATEADIAAAAATGVKGIHLSIPTSDIHLETMDRTRDWARDTLQRVLGVARPSFEFVSVGAQDASRADLDFLIDLARISAAAGAERFRLADTVGIWTPSRIAETVGELVTEVPDIGIGVHTHNDLGMATANAVSAVEAGARYVDTTVNGIGERTGNASLAEVAMAVQVADIARIGVDPRHLRLLSRRVTECSGVPLPINAPILGRNAFRHESGIHVKAQLRNRAAYEPFDPSLLGDTPTGSAPDIVIGKHSGSCALQHVLGDCGILVSSTTATDLLPHVRRAAEMRRRCLTPGELLSLYRQAVTTH